MLRAHLFMEELWKDYTRPGIKKGTYSFSVPRDKPLCLTSVKDMGVVAARCLLEARTGTLEVVSDVRTPGGLADDFAAAFAELPPLQSFASFLEETKWSDADRTYEDLARP